MSPPLWYDEGGAIWRPLSEIPAPIGERFDLVVTEISKRHHTYRIARMIADTSGDSPMLVAEQLSELPATVLRGTTYSTAEGIRDAVASKGASAELHHHVFAGSPPPDD